MLIRYDYGEKKVWSVVCVPSPEAEDKWHLHRQLSTRRVDRTRHINRIKGLLVGQGVRMPVGADFLERLAKVRLWDGSALPKGLRSRLEREYACLQFVNQQIKGLEAERTEAIRTSDDPSVEKVRRLMRLRGIGDNSAWLFVMEFFGFAQDKRQPSRSGALRQAQDKLRKAVSRSSERLLRRILHGMGRAVVSIRWFR